MSLNLKIVSPRRIEYQGEVENVFVPGAMGQFEILKGHAAIISLLTTGDVAYTDADGRHSMKIAGGFVEVKKNTVSLCVELVEEEE